MAGLTPVAPPGASGGRPGAAAKAEPLGYLRLKKVPELIDGLISRLIDEQPDDPQAFIASVCAGAAAGSAAAPPAPVAGADKPPTNPTVAYPSAGPAECPVHPVPYFDLEPFHGDNMQRWTKDGDVIVSCAAKCGTNWMLNIVHQIRTFGDDDALDVNVVTPWVELKQKPGQTFDERLDQLNNLVLPEGTEGGGTKLKDHWDNPKYPYRAFKSHYAPKGGEEAPPDCCLEPRRYPHVKFIAMGREGKDVIKSFTPFFENHSEEWRQLWGGFPPVFPSKEAALGFCAAGPGQGMYFGYMNAWWPYRHDPNVLLLHFADAKRDLEGMLRKVAAFVGVNVPEDKWAGVVERCGFPWMKKHQKKFHYRVWGNEALDKTGFKVMKDIDGSIIRKGIIGDHEGFFTEEMTKQYDETVGKHFGHDLDLKRWAAEGNTASPGMPF